MCYTQNIFMFIFVFFLEYDILLYLLIEGIKDLVDHKIGFTKDL